MTETIKNIDSYIKESEAILADDDFVKTMAQITIIKQEVGVLVDKLDVDWNYSCYIDMHDDIDKKKLESLIAQMKNYYAKLVDEYNKQQNDYLLEKQRNRLTIICSIIGVIGVVVGAILTFILSKFLS